MLTRGGSISLPRPLRNLDGDGPVFVAVQALAGGPEVELLQALGDGADAARAVLERDGLIFFDRWQQPREHPLVAVERAIRGQFKDIMKALDLRAEAGVG